MIIDASTVFVLVVSAGLVVLLGWAEMYSRRHHNATESRNEAAPTASGSSGGRARPAKRR